MKKLGILLSLFLLLLLPACAKDANAPSADTVTLPDAGETVQKPQEPEKETILVGVLSNGEQINIRSGPSTDSSVLGKALQGQLFEVTAQNAAPGWHQVVYQDGFAYIGADYLYLSEWETDSRLLLAKVVDVQGSVNVRKDPSTTGEILGKGILGASFIVRKENFSEGWHQVDWQGSAAYISAKYLEVQQTTISDAVTK